MQSKNKLFVPLPVSVIVKLQKLAEKQVLTPEECAAALIEAKIKEMQVLTPNTTAEP